MILLRLYWEFFKTGLFAMGGGMATVPFLQDIAEKTGWYTSAQLADMIALSESTPGPLGVNMATYVGYTVGSEQLGGFAMGAVGAVIATAGLVTPSILIILAVSYFLARFRTSRTVDAALYGLRPASVALISSAGVDIVLLCILGVESLASLNEASVSGKAIALAAAVYLCTNYVPKLKKLHPIVFIAASALAGIVLHMG